MGISSVSTELMEQHGHGLILRANDECFSRISLELVFPQGSKFAINIVNDGLQKVINKSTPSTGKLSIFVFRRMKIPIKESLNVHSDNVYNNRKDTAKFLGEYKTESLSWNNHIATVAKIYLRLFTFMYKCRSLLPLQCRIV